MIYLRLLIPLIFLFSVTTAYGKEPIRILEGTVVKVSDGDTINVQSGRTKVKVRLYGMDAPETEKSNKKTGHISKPGQPYGDEAWRCLTAKIDKKKVRVEVMDIDRYRRLVALVYLDGRNINKEMVIEGHAWAYRQYLDRPYASVYIKAEELARRKKLGLWRQANPQPPWEFRRTLK